ncbi:MAG TPA: response regulator [Haliangium sp.]|nr:response regulator [Haliangium sp.]
MPTEPTVLIIDDNMEMAANLQEILEDEGVRVDVAQDGYQALTKLDENGFDLVITDIRMPGMSGIDVLKTVHERWPTLPVIVMTAYSADATLEEAHTAGALDVLAKPVDIDHVIDLVERITEPHARVLLVEDDRNLRVGLAEALLDIAKVVPYAAATVSDARRLAAEIQFRVAIVDVHLPDGDGVTLAAALKERQPGLAIVYITGYGGQHDALAEVLKSPQMHLLEKPFQPERLLDLVRSAV